MPEPETPIVCTLGADDLPARLSWIASLNARALQSQRRDDLTLELEFTADAYDDVLELVRRESACCGFLDFRLEPTAEAVRLTVRAPERAREAAGVLFDALVSTNTRSCQCR